MQVVGKLVSAGQDRSGCESRMNLRSVDPVRAAQSTKTGSAVMLEECVGVNVCGIGINLTPSSNRALAQWYTFLHWPTAELRMLVACSGKPR